MVKLVYRPEGEPTGLLTLVGKGIMYDAGGLALKPGDEVHATMKNDMTGAGAIFGAMTALRDLGCESQVTGYLMCTDNMPSGSAMAPGRHHRDARRQDRRGHQHRRRGPDVAGRRPFVLGATRNRSTAIVDIATLTGPGRRTRHRHRRRHGQRRGPGRPGQGVGRAGRRAGLGAATGQPLPARVGLHARRPAQHGRRQRRVDHGRAVPRRVRGRRPWAHIDIAGTAQSWTASKWRNKGTTGFGARLLVDLALNFKVRGARHEHRR